MEDNEAKHTNALRKKTKVYLSVDQVDKNEPENELDYPPELPPHELKVMENCPVMLLRNINPDAELCNGTRMLIEEMAENILKCILLTGERKGEKVLIPKITLTSGDGDFGFKLYRKQFPVKVCYAMTINKSPGQTIHYVGVDLSEPVFTHGQTCQVFEIP